MFNALWCEKSKAEEPGFRSYILHSQNLMYFMSKDFGKNYIDECTLHIFKYSFKKIAISFERRNMKCTF